LIQDRWDRGKYVSLKKIKSSCLKRVEIDLSQIVGIEGDELRLDLLEQGLDLGLAALLLRLVRVCLQRVEVRLPGA
jgi:hypothetical protein